MGQDSALKLNMIIIIQYIFCYTMFVVHFLLYINVFPADSILPFYGYISMHFVIIAAYVIFAFYWKSDNIDCANFRKSVVKMDVNTVDKYIFNFGFFIIIHGYLGGFAMYIFFAEAFSYFSSYALTGVILGLSLPPMAIQIPALCSDDIENSRNMSTSNLNNNVIVTPSGTKVSYEIDCHSSKKSLKKEKKGKDKKNF